MSVDHCAFAGHHNHQDCIDQAMSRARALCRQREQRLTPIRELVLKLIWQSHKPLGAYDLLPALAAAGFNSAPPTVYRALEFLQELGLVHRLASLNAFIGCSQPHQEHSSYFFICQICQLAEERSMPSLHQALQAQADELGFKILQETVEVLGICPACRSEHSHHA
ncbi:Fur family transcriptional regulator [Nitrincola tapanii]|uniref:Transcriptional repressor n=1 Tax=Nitrincola tapanii TaxID=1708751 RepID=A0A5A9VZ89_9GAMM|nr:Fur family transcriptional regulator [Nitrincola tapanii]KAA0873796.1 transcriptional repressor [Nitrincola tapanii]